MEGRERNVTNAINILPGKPETKILFKSQIWERACQETSRQLGGLMNLPLVALIYVWNRFDIAWQDESFDRWVCSSCWVVFQSRSQNCEKRFLASSCLSVCPSVRMEQLSSHEKDFREIWYLSIFRKSVETVRVSLKSDKITAYFTWRPMNIFIITLIINQQMNLHKTSHWNT